VALNANSYGSVYELAALMRHQLDGASSFDSATVPALDEVEEIIDRVSGVLNVALAGVGLTTPVSNETAVYACADWVIRHSAGVLRGMYPHLGVGSDAPGGIEYGTFAAAREFAQGVMMAFKNLGVAVTAPVSEGLAFTALEKHSERSDPDSTTYEQPKFRRGKWDNIVSEDNET
jgi:hypothetical protein